VVVSLLLREPMSLLEPMALAEPVAPEVAAGER
jgi:hypothetical protein